METRFSVAAVNEQAVRVYLQERDFLPCRIDRAEGQSALVFAPMPDAAMRRLAFASPVHLSNKIGIVCGDSDLFAGRRGKAGDC